MKARTPPLLPVRWHWALSVVLIAVSGVTWEWQLERHRRAEESELNQAALELAAAIKRQKAEIDGLKSQIRVWEAAIPGDSPIDDATGRTGEITTWADNLSKLRRFVAEHPEQTIPQMRLNGSPQDWLFWARTEKTDTPEALRQVMADIRNGARGLMMERMEKALPKYLAAHDGILPASPADLAPFLGSEVDAEMLGRYRMLISGKASENQGNLVLSEKAPPTDERLDTRYYFGIETFGLAMGWAQGELQEARQDARIAFAQANGRKNQGAAELLPYISSPVHRGYLEATLAYSAAHAGKTANSLADLQPFLLTPEAKMFAERFWDTSH